MVHKAIPIVVGVVGLVLVLLASILGWVVLPKVIDKKIEEEVRLVEGSETWDKWAEITLPIQMKFYIFAVKNGPEVLQGAYPILEERGPYVYDEIRTKTFYGTPGDTITYRQNITYIFNEEDSAKDLDEEIDILNVAFISVMHGIEEQVKELIESQLPPGLHWIAPIATGIALNAISYDLTVKYCQETAIRRIKPTELFFDGFDVSCYFENFLLKEALKNQDEFRGQRFGLYRANNETDDGLYTIHSGISDHTEFGRILSWENKTMLGWWNQDPNNLYCDMVNGTDGSIYPPFVDEILRVFVVDLCRSLYLTYNSRTEFLGIKGYRFTVPREMLEDPRINKDNRCFCMEENEADCPGGGAIDVAHCRGAPIVMSAPYFLDGDYEYTRNLKILDGPFVPDREKHQTIMDVEPNSGVLMQAKKRLQVNIHVRNYERYMIPAFTKLQPMDAFPLIWVEESASLDDESADDLKSKLLNPLKIIKISKWTVLGVGIFVTIVGIAWFVFNR